MDTLSTKRLFLLVDLLLIALAVYMGVKGIYAVVASRLDTLPPATTSSSTSVSIQQAKLPPYSDYRAIVQRNLFHTFTESENTDEDIDINSLEKTELKLKLRGTMPSDNPEDSFAIIEDESKRKQDVYKIGDTIQNATIMKISSDAVMLSVSGSNKALLFPDRSESSSTSTSRTTSTLTASTSSSTTTTTRISLSRSVVESAMENLSELMTQVTINYQNEDGVEGLALSNIKPNSIFRRMGLRNGDVLVAVEGQPLTSADQALQLYENLKSSDSASVEINRRGRSRIIQYRIR